MSATDVLVECLEMIGLFLTVGAIGFRYAATGPGHGGPGEKAVHERAERRAAAFGLIGSLTVLYHIAVSISEQATRRHLTVGAAATTPPSMLWIASGLLATLGFAIAARARAGWPLAALGVVVGVLRAPLLGRFAALGKGVHILAGGLWLGTLFLLVTGGIQIASGSDPAERRAATVARMVHRFSGLALAGGAVLATSGLFLAWRELRPLSSLWSTPYGLTLIAKLCGVAFVFGLGAWNWRRQRPRLGTDAGTGSLVRSAAAELAAAALVLLVTAILVNQQSPADMHH